MFENQLFVFVLLLSKILALSLPIIQEKNGQIAISLDEKAIGNHLYHNPEPIQRFYELISAYVITGMVNNAPRYNISPEAYRLTEYFIDSMEIFILSHEYGHLLNGHLGDNNIVKNNLIVKSTLGIEPVNEVHLKWAQEWEADLTATKIAIASSEVTGINPAWIHASIYLFFMA